MAATRWAAAAAAGGGARATRAARARAAAWVWGRGWRKSVGFQGPAIVFFWGGRREASALVFDPERAR